MKRTQTGIDKKYIDVLDGIRAISIIIVMVFHFWQQTWIFPKIKTPFLSFLKIDAIDFSSFAMVGYLFVDMMVLLSGFLLFLPLMRQVFMGDEMIDWKMYAKKRIARILPSYYFAVLVTFFFFALPSGGYASTSAAIKDLVTHLTFTQTLFVNTYLQTKCGVVLWTVAIEVWFYILFPFIAEMIKRRDGENGKSGKATSIAAIALVFVALQFIFIYWRENRVLKQGAYVAMLLNQLPAFASVYANGMLAAMLYVLAAKYCERSSGLAAAGTAVSIVSIVYITYLIKSCASLPSADAQIWQISERTKLSVAFVVFILSTSFAAGWYRFIFSNKLMKFLNAISYNLYIWHQWLAVQIKYEWRIPHWEGTVPPNQQNYTAWMNKYALIITVAAFAAAILTTYLVEKPCSNLIMGKPMFKKPKKTELKAKK